MKKEDFIPYKEMLMGVISHAKNMQQAFICRNMIERFTECFLLLVPPFELNEARLELYDALEWAKEGFTNKDNYAPGH